MHTLRKLGRTLQMLFILGMARMFGQYKHSGWDGNVEYALYQWRGKLWMFPTSQYTEQ